MSTVINIDAKNQSGAFIVEVLKASIIYKDMLNDFERDFSSGLIHRYAKSGAKTQVRGKQWEILNGIGLKLNIKKGNL